MFIVGGALPALYIAYLGIRHTVKRVTLEEPEDILFTEIAEPEGVAAVGGDEATAARIDMSAEVAPRRGLRRAARWSARSRSSGCSAHTHRRSLRYRTAGLRLRRRRTTTGSARRASTCGRTSSTTSAGSCATAPRRTSATAARARTTAPTPTAAARSSGPLDPWPHSEAGRFHRGIVAAARRRSRALLVVVEGVRHHAPAEAAAAARACCAAAALPARWLAGDLRAHPAGFPAPTAAHGLRMRGHRRRRRARASRWASQNRPEGRTMTVVAGVLARRWSLAALAVSLRVLREYERGVVFRLGRLRRSGARAWSC